MTRDAAPPPVPDPERPAQGVITDVDGTLIDSNQAHALAWAAAFAEHGYVFSPLVIRPLIGLGGPRVLQALTGLAADEEPGLGILARRREIFGEELLSKLAPLPGAPALLRALRMRGVRIAVASAAEGPDLEQLLEATGVDALIDARVSADDVARTKPDPEAVVVALARLGLTASDALMLGDTPYDVEAGRRAGVPVLALRCGGWHDDALAGAVAIFDDPADVLVRLARPPLSRWLPPPQRGA